MAAAPRLADEISLGESEAESEPPPPVLLGQGHLREARAGEKVCPQCIRIRPNTMYYEQALSLVCLNAATPVHPAIPSPLA